MERRRRKYSNVSSRDSEVSVTCASWTGPSNDDGSAYVVLGKAGSAGVLELAAYDFKQDFLSEVHILSEEAAPVSMSVHPGGDGIICSFSKSCKYFEMNGGKLELKASDKDLSPLQGVGCQKCLAFSVDGSKFAAGGEDGHLRIFEWPSLKVLLDEPKAHSSFKDLDFSLDSAFLASTSHAGPARVWDILKAIPLVTLTRDQGESIGFCRFSRDGTKPFLFGTVTKGGKASIAVWDISTWRKLGVKNFFDTPISAFNISRNGKFLATGSANGDICIIDVQKMEVRHSIKRAHIGTTVALVEFSSNGRALLSVSTEWAARVNLIPDEAEWKDWQIYLVLLALVLISGIMFYIFFEYSDSFWNFPLGREQPAKPPIEAILGDS